MCTYQGSTLRNRFWNVPRPVWAISGRILAATCAVVMLSGCATQTGLVWKSKEDARPPELSYIQPGDELAISFLGAPDLNTERTVRRDGRMNLRLVGEVTAAGKTPEALQKELQKLYTKHIQAVETSVTIRSNPPVFVSGAVKRPGRVLLDYPMTAFEAVAESGGFDEREAEVRNVLVIRHEKGERFGYSLNLKPALNGEISAVFHLQPFDIVYVPRTRIVKIGQWIDQHINSLIPRMGGLGVTSGGDVYYGL